MTKSGAPLCECGCRSRVGLNKRTGKYNRFIAGHNLKPVKKRNWLSRWLSRRNLSL